MSAGIEVVTSMFEDDRYMSRDQVLETYLTPNGSKQGLAPEQLFELDQQDIIAKLRPTSSSILDQIRQVYDKEHLLGIGRDIHFSPHGQLQNCGVAVFTTEVGLKQYLADAGDHHETDYIAELGRIRVHKKLGGFAVTVFGHNRQLGTAAVNKELYGHPDKGLTFRAKVIHDPDYADALAMQAIENGGQAPKIWERAMSMESYRNVRWRQGDPVNNNQIAKIFGTTEDQVWRAQQFMELPETIKRIVIQGDIPYTGAIEFERLVKVYSEAEIEALARYCVEQNLKSAGVRDLVNTHLLVLDFTPEIYELSMSGQLKLDQLREIENFKKIGLDDSELNRIASWIATDKPRLSEVRKLVEEQTKIRRAGVRSIFEPEAESRVFELEAASDQDNTKQLVRKALQDISGRLAAVSALRTSGLADSELVTDSVRAYVAEHIAELSSHPKLLDQVMTLLQTEESDVREARLEELRQNFDELRASAQPYSQGALL